MVSENKKLSIAFFWHMHQPNYQINPQSDYLMPWVRLHAIKDYLDMVLIMDKYPKLRLNFNLVPVLIDAILEYGERDFQDVYSRLTLTQVEDLTDEDKFFILNNFFDANYQSMILHHPNYQKLYEKRFETPVAKIEEFSNQEYSDIMAWFNIAWFDSIYSQMFPQLKEIVDKGEGFTFEDRQEIINYQKKIIKMIIPAYQKYSDEKRIEITTSPYYHPILPILLDIKCAHRNIHNPEALPANLKMSQDAKLQTQLALDRIEEVFGKRPKGIWPPEHCVSSKTFEMLKDLGVEWTISDEGILANSINIEFVRDFKGYLEDPYFLLKTYEYKTKNSNLQVIFRDSSIPNLISFDYPNMEPQNAANDLYDRIKVIQNKILTSPDEAHLLTIAIDGENCWENYSQDGAGFLEAVYDLIENDESLETVLISDYLLKDKNKKPLPKIYSGSWINRNFQLWIGEPTKNQAWNYLKKVKDDFLEFCEKNPNHPNIETARKEIFIAQGSDWFWWYGEPNNSGQDHIFDYLFRTHLKNVYEFLDLQYPNYLDNTLILATPSKYPISKITPVMDGQDKIDDEWLNAGFVTMPENMVSDSSKVFEKICFGFDENNLYLRFYLNHEAIENNTSLVNQMFVYMRNNDKSQDLASICLVNPNENIFQIMKEKFHNELRISMVNKLLRPLQFAKAITGGVWVLRDSEDIKVAYDNVIDISIPFELIDIDYGDMMEFFFVNADFGVQQTFIPQEVLLMMKRPPQS